MAHHLFSESDYPIYACNMQHMTYDGAATFTQFWLVCFTGDWICPCRYLDFLVWPFCICQTQSFTFACFGAGVLDFSRNKFCIFHVQSSTFSDRWHPHLSEFLVWLVTVCFVKKRKPSFKMGYVQLGVVQLGVDPSCGPPPLGLPPLHYAAFPIRKCQLEIWARFSPQPPFSWALIISDKIFGFQSLCRFREDPVQEKHGSNGLCP